MNNTHSFPTALEVRHLRLVRAVAEDGNLTRAASRLHLTPSALSHQLKELEGRLGTPLFLRAGRRMVATAAAERVARAAEEVLGQLGRLEQDVRLGADAARGVLRLATECSTVYHWLPRVLPHFRRLYPAVEVQIVLEATRRPLPALLDGRLDLAIVTDETLSARVARRPLFGDEMVALARPGHPVLKGSRVTARDLAAHTLLMYDIPPEHSTLFRRILDPAHVRPARVLRLELTEALFELAAAGEGVAVMAAWAAAPWLESGRLQSRPLHPRRLRRTWQAATVRRRVAPPWLGAFVEVLAASGAPVPAAAAG
jgi:LysR family transcriptional regulator for metE and metH